MGVKAENCCEKGTLFLENQAKLTDFKKMGFHFFSSTYLHQNNADLKYARLCQCVLPPIRRCSVHRTLNTQSCELALK